MPGPILIDTDVLVDFLRGHAGAGALLREHAGDLVLSSIVVAELFAGARNASEQSVLDDVVGVLPVVPVSAAIARDAGLLKQRYHRSHGTGLGDAVVAATALSLGAALKTLNVKHYPMFSGLKPAYRR